LIGDKPPRQQVGLLQVLRVGYALAAVHDGRLILELLGRLI